MRLWQDEDQVSVQKDVAISRAFKFLLLVMVAALALFWVATDSEADVPPARAPSPHQVKLARDLFADAHTSRAQDTPAELVLGEEQLGAVTALVAPKFAPDRIGIKIRGDTLTITGSRQLPLGGRWLNVRAEISGAHRALPTPSIQIGAVALPDWAAQTAMEQLRGYASRHGSSLAQLEGAVRSIAVDDGQVKLSVMMPEAGVIEAALRGDNVAIPPERVGALYCALARAQQAAPSADFVVQLQRALKASEPRQGDHAAALVALSILTVDDRTAELVVGAADAVKPCKMPPVATTLQQRHDWANHWSLSAALTVTLGPEVALAMGEWKELADSAPDTAVVGAANPGAAKVPPPSGFSFSDVAADRSGYFIASALTDPGRLKNTRDKVLRASDGDLLPRTATDRNPPMTNAEFAKRFGSIRDPRFRTEIKAIDSALNAAWEQAD